MDTKQFLETLYSNADGYISLWEKTTKKTCFIDISNIDTIVDTAMSVRDDIYFGVNLGSKPKTSGRFIAEEITIMPALYLDIDIAGPNHKKTNLPVDVDQAMAFINELPIEPSIIVSSGSGLHCYYIFKEPWQLESPEERLQAQAISKGWQDYIRNRTKWHIDSTHDLPRVLRLPGTFNVKNSKNPVEVTVISSNDNRYNPSDFSQYAAEITTVEKRDKFKRNPSDGTASMAIDNCKFLQICRDHADKLSEPQWLAMITNIARCSDGPAMVHELSKPYAGYSEQETNDKIFHALNDMHPQTCEFIRNTLGFGMCPDQGCGVKSPCGWALAKSKKPIVDSDAETIDKPVPDGFFDTGEEIPGITKLTDTGNAERFGKMFKNKLQYCKQMGKWLVWNGKIWSPDESDQMFSYAKKCVRSMHHIAASIDDVDFRKSVTKFANSSESLKNIKAMITIAQGELPVSLGQLDGNKWMLNCKNGTIDLKTGNLLPHSPESNSTKITDTEYITDAVCPTFDKFIYDIFDGNQQVIDFMQRFLGYCLTGDTREQQFVIAFGSGRNGKGTLLNLVLDILGDYAKTTPAETIYKKQTEKISNDIARLAAARFVLISEGEEGKRFDEPLIKKMTGQDRMSARFLYKEDFEFMPQFKLCLMTNDKPTARGDDAALWSRIQLVPFTQKFEGAKQDKTLVERLRTDKEKAGVMRWLVEGCLRWQREGLNPPSEVVQATAEYRNESDKFQAWIDECCATGPLITSLSSELYKSFESWSLSNGERRIVTSTIFGKHLVLKGFESFRGSGGIRKYRGIGLLTEHNEKQIGKENPF